MFHFILWMYDILTQVVYSCTHFSLFSNRKILEIFIKIANHRFWKIFLKFEHKKKSDDDNDDSMMKELKYKKKYYENVEFNLTTLFRSQHVHALLLLLSHLYCNVRSSSLLLFHIYLLTIFFLLSSLISIPSPGDMHTGSSALVIHRFLFLKKKNFFSFTNYWMNFSLALKPNWSHDCI